MQTTVSGANATIAIHAGESQLSGGLALKIDPSVAFVMEPGVAPGYSRNSHPTGDACADALAALEGARRCLLTNSGMAAISATLLCLLKPGDHIVAPDSIYSATHALLTRHLGQWGIDASFVDTTDLRNIERARRENTRVLWLESPSNPLLKLTDLAAAASWAREKGIVTVADNTFSTPIGSRPLDLGVDIVVHSATKYIAGHGDLLAGAVLTDENFADKIAPWIGILGGNLSAQGAWTLRRGLYTLPLRFAQHTGNALAVARALETHPLVERVHFPGLASHPQHKLANAQMPGGCGGVLSFELKSGIDACVVLHNTRLCAPALSLGEPRTLIAHPATMHYRNLCDVSRAALGISDSLLRVAVGLEDPQDIVADLFDAMEKGVRGKV